MEIVLYILAGIGGWFSVSLVAAGIFSLVKNRSGNKTG